jgi:hypothetical protein
LLRELIGIAAEIGEANDFVALIVMPQYDALPAEGLARPKDTVIEGVIGEYEIILEIANRCCCCRHSKVSLSALDASARRMIAALCFALF